jgi:hypothetical protein
MTLEESMENRTNNRNTQGNWLTRGLTIPAWLLLLIALLAILASVLRIQIPDFIWVLVALLLLLMGWLPKRDGGGTSKELSDPAASDYRIRVSNYPRYANPTLLTIADRGQLRDLNKDPQIGAVTSVAGDLVFAVNRFDSPVELVMNYTAEDERRLNERKELLAPKDVDLVPIYLHTPTTEEGEATDRIWRPFEEFTLDPERKQAKITVSSWGDSPTGWGTRP